MLSNKWLKYINSLQIKKYRLEHQAFLVEGKKSVEELLHSSLTIKYLFASKSFIYSNEKLLQGIEVHECTEDELTKVGTFENNNSAIAVANYPSFNSQNIDYKANTIVLDHIQDPGNLGTIIRTADWYGINQIICSENTTDAFAPKVVNSSMGSLFRTNIIYTPLPAFLQKTETAIYGALLNGENIHTTKTSNPFTLVIGNESNGISNEINGLIKNKITIPRFGETESLNAAIATAILLDNFSRNY